MHVILDTETTGLNAGKDELLQVSIIDRHGAVLIDQYIKPDRATEWPEAMQINGITPEMVADEPSIHDPYIHDKIQYILSTADKIIGYNVDFDIKFLVAAGFVVSESVYLIDVMRDFAEVYGDYREDLGGYKWQKLITAAEYYGYEWPINAHNALGDCLATLHVYQCMQDRRRLRPCPFCGSDRVVFVPCEDSGSVLCNSCLASMHITDISADADDVIQLYNRRAGDESHGGRTVREYIDGMLRDDPDDEYARCDRCGTYVHRDSMYAGICAECQAEDAAQSERVGWHSIEEILHDVMEEDDTDE